MIIESRIIRYRDIYMHTIHVILLENYVLFILVFYIVIYLIIPVVIVVLKCIVLISTVLFKLSLLYHEKGLIIENKICHCHHSEGYGCSKKS